MHKIQFIPYVLGQSVQLIKFIYQKESCWDKLIPTENDNTNVFPETVYADHL